MVKKSKEQHINNIIRTLKNLKTVPERESDYLDKLSSYINMRDGGNGGLFRNTDISLRELHFKNWKNSDFQTILVSLEETPKLSEEAWEIKFGKENKTFLDKVFDFFSIGKKRPPDSTTEE